MNTSILIITLFCSWFGQNSDSFSQEDWKAELKKIPVYSTSLYLTPASVDSVMNLLPQLNEKVKFFMIDSVGNGVLTTSPNREYDQIKEEYKNLTLMVYDNAQPNRTYQYLYLLNYRD